MCKSVGPDNTHPRALKELADAVAKCLAIIFEKSRLSSKVPGNQKKGNITSFFNKGRKEDPGNNRLVSFMSVAGKVMEWILLKEMLRHMQAEKVIRDSQHSFTKHSLRLTNLVAFCD